MKTLLAPVFVLLALGSAAVPLSAHHSWPVNTSRLVTVKGTVTELAWENPHPTKKVVSIDYVKVGDTPAGPFCVAMTLEEK